MFFWGGYFGWICIFSKVVLINWAWTMMQHLLSYFSSSSKCSCVSVLFGSAIFLPFNQILIFKLCAVTVWESARIKWETTLGISATFFCDYKIWPKDWLMFQLYKTTRSWIDTCFPCMVAYQFELDSGLKSSTLILVVCSWGSQFHLSLTACKINEVCLWTSVSS